MNKARLLLGFLFLFTFTYGQSLNDVWELVLKNQREEALRQATALHKKNPTVESLLTLELVKGENGQMPSGFGFLDEFLSYEDREPFLYAMWTQGFFFEKYTITGFSKKLIERVRRVAKEEFSNQTLREAMLYLDGISDRYCKQMDSYNRKVSGMSSVKSWQYCGAFENMNNGGIDVVYEPEFKAKSEEDFNANSNGWMNWYKAPHENEGYNFFTSHNEYGAGVNYAQSFFNCPSAREAWINIGASGKFKFWLNDVLILESAEDVKTDLDAYRVKVQMPAGNNRLLMKLAEPDGVQYFIVRITDENGISFDDLRFSDDYAPYSVSSEKDLNPVRLNTAFEDFFLQRVEANPSDIFSHISLYYQYMRNGRYGPAKELIEKLRETYPKSSFLRVRMIETLYLEEDFDHIREVKKNLENDDPNYSLSLFYQFENTRELFRMSMEDMDKLLSNLEDAIDDEIVQVSVDMMRALRLQDKKAMKKHLDELVEIGMDRGNGYLIRRYAPLYVSVINDDRRTIEVLEKFDARYMEYSIREQIVSYYKDKNERDKVMKILEEDVRNFPNDIHMRTQLVNAMIAYGQYKQALPVIDRILELYPYSFIAMELKGDALMFLNREEEALEYYERSLVYNSGNSSLRKNIRDITNQSDIFEEYRTIDMYDFIKENRGKSLENNYGYLLLIDEIMTELYKEAGGKTRFTFAYEITSQNGVDQLTEYNLNVSGAFHIIKSEVIKPNGSIVPANRNYDQLVFSGLEIGDVIYIDYQIDFNGYGRFYRDFIDTYQVDAYIPVVRGLYMVIAPKSTELNYVVHNGDLECKKEDRGDFIVYTWEENNMDPMPDIEDYMPVDEDVMRYLYISTIDSWADIANWYSDLVRPQVIINSEVQKTFDGIFPEADPRTLSEDERSRRIYQYITENFNYSYVPFLQSSYTPQKPSRIIKTKLGDCKDFSTLYMTLAQMAGLEANLVLVLTSDYGENGLVLPSKNFNHCIAKVKIDGRDRYIELTDKYLPYGAIPNSLENALILEIPNKSGPDCKSELKVLKNPERMENGDHRHLTIRLNGDMQEVRVDSRLTGSARGAYFDEFEGSNQELTRKSVAEMMSSLLKDNGTVDSVFNIHMEKRSDSLSFSVQMTVKDKPRSIGSFKIFEIPVVASAYTGEIIKEEERKYPIFYQNYEFLDHYTSTYDILIEGEGEFSELPENVTLSFKKHSYKRTYDLVDPKHLRVSVDAVTDRGMISAEEYPEFREYVQQIIEAKEAFVGYK